MCGPLPPHAQRRSDEVNIFLRLHKFHGIDPILASNRLHAIKADSTRGARETFSLI
jgi:hypothetical protein